MWKWSGWLVANLLVVILIWQKVVWQKEEQHLRSELELLQERTLVLEQSIADLHVQLDRLDERGLKNAVNDAGESLSDHFSSALEKLRQGVKQLKDKAAKLNKKESQDSAAEDQESPVEEELL